ncbi:hypothetical protein RvY_01945 [Ramazzottius varieornatus]|uniref:Uncharacterized protein n=1 Tax=Ramazzottius varieornatus TaxID=947166 RepID=A0A1D1ULH0_RAMVA|nr:hypothetical protein RvY_01945 [Ramazzottius varieornatus]
MEKKRDPRIENPLLQPSPRFSNVQKVEWTGYATETWHAKADLPPLVDEVQAYRVSVAEDTAGKLADLERERLRLDHKIAVQRQKATAATAIANAQ